MLIMTLGGEDLTAPFSHALYLFRQDPQRSICIGKRNSQRECTGHHLILAGNSKGRSPLQKTTRKGLGLRGQRQQALSSCEVIKEPR